MQKIDHFTFPTRLPGEPRAGPSMQETWLFKVRGPSLDSAGNFEPGICRRQVAASRPTSRENGRAYSKDPNLEQSQKICHQIFTPSHGSGPEIAISRIRMLFLKAEDVPNAG
jgi:hypothetical protein